MDIKRSRAVQTFKLYGYRWYESAQKLPIDRYKDLLLLFEFIEKLLRLSHRNELVATIQQRYLQYRTQSITHPDYGPMIEMIYRRRISFDHLKDFLQSYLLNQAHIHYHDEDQLKAYINDRAISIALAIGAIIGVSPAGYNHVVALSEGCWIMHMLIECHSDLALEHYYIPQSILDQFGVSITDLKYHSTHYITSEPIKTMVRSYVDKQEKFFIYALEGLPHVDHHSKDAVMRLISLYEYKSNQVKKHDYNIFHPALRQSTRGIIKGYPIYWFYRFIGK